MFEAGQSRDPGSLSAEDELAVIELDRDNRDRLTHEIIPSRNKEWTFYLMAHRPPGPTDPESPDYNPNHYIFFTMSPEDERAKDKAFILFLDETPGNYVRVVNTEGLRDRHERQGLSEGDLLTHPEPMQDFWQMVELQGGLGSAIPNHEDMEDFADIINAWQHHQGSAAP